MNKSERNTGQIFWNAWFDKTEITEDFLEQYKETLNDDEKKLIYKFADLQEKKHLWTGYLAALVVVSLLLLFSIYRFNRYGIEHSWFYINYAWVSYVIIPGAFFCLMGLVIMSFNAWRFNRKKSMKELKKKSVAWYAKKELVL